MMLMLAATVSLSVGCGPLSGESGGEGETFNDHLKGNISSLDPATATGESSLTVLGNAGEGLYRTGENGKPVPGMAEGVEVGEEGTRYVFTLREGIRWSNGEPVVAQDFEYAWLRAMAPDTSGERANLMTEFIEGGTEFAAGEIASDEVGVEALDERTLEVRLKEPTPFFLDLTTLPIYLPLKESFVEQWGEEFATSPDSLLYNGPYEMTGFDPARGMKLEKREGYWDASDVETETIDGRVYGGPRPGKYESGELDVTVLGPGLIPEYEADRDFEQHTDFTTFSLYMNDEDPAMSNLSLRRAVQSGFNRESFVEAVLGDGSAPAYGYVPYGMSSGSGEPDDESFREHTGDTVPEMGTREARRYWERGVEELGEEPTLTILTGNGNRDREAGAFLREQLEESLGAEVEIEIVTPDVLRQRQIEGEYQILASRHRARYDNPASYLAPRDSESPLDSLRPITPRYEKLVDALSEADGERRAELLARAERILVEEEALVAPIFYPGDSYLVSPEIQNYTTHPYGLPVDYRHVEVDE